MESTVYSLSEDPPAFSAERRSGERHLTIFRVGAMIVDGRRELCLIKNISAGGMMLRAYCPLEPGQRVQVELKTGQPVAGTIGWARSGQAGISFDRPIDVLGILANEDGGTRPRMPRIETKVHVQVREGAASYRLQACDISQGGIKVEGPVVLTPSADVVVSMTGLPPQPGVVRWVHDGQAGISFNRLIALPELVAWLQAQRATRNAA